MKDVAIELEKNKGASEVMKRMVDRLMVRREELSKKRKEIEKSGGGADFGNTIATSREAGARDSDITEGTIVQ